MRVPTAALLALSCLILLPGPPAGAAEKAAGPQRMFYDVYAGGIHAVEATLDVNVEKARRYRMEMRAHTRGFLAALAPWKGSFETMGWWLKGGALTPELHRSVSTWRDEVEIKEYKYGKDGSFLGYRVEEAGKDKTPKTIEPDLTENSTDALTATLMVMEALADGKPCEGASEVFDGDRRYRLIFRDRGPERLESSRYNIYEGPAIRCEVEVEPMQGRWHSKPRGWLSIQEQGRKQGALPTVWMASMEEGAPAVPVKVRVKTDYGTLFSHLTGYDNGAEKIGSALEGKKIEDR